MTYLPGLADATTAASVSLEYDHHEVHAGAAFSVEHDGASIAAGASLVFAFRVPSGTKHVHLTAAWRSEAAATFEFGPGTWDTSSGSAVTPTNHRTDSATASIVLGDSTGSWVADTVVKDPTTPVVTAGTRQIREVAHVSRQAGGAESRGERERLLTGEDEYLAVLTNDDVAAKGLWLRVSWYEHTDLT